MEVASKPNLAVEDSRPNTHQEYVDFRRQRVTHAELHRKPNKWLLHWPRLGEAQRVLDIACGMGYNSIAWARVGRRTVGFDFNFDLVKSAAELAAAEGLKIDFAVGDATCFPVASNYFDICFSENLFEHVPQWQEIAREAIRVLRDGGVFFVRTTNRQCPYNTEINNLHFYPWLPQALKRPILRWIQRNRPAWINYSMFPAVNWFTYRGLAKSLRAMGFETYEVFDLVERDRLSPSRQRIYFLFHLLKRVHPLRYLIYPWMRSVQILAVKKNSVAEV